MQAKLNWLSLPAICLALSVTNTFADTAASPPAMKKLPATAAPPACVCSNANEGGFVIANCQCGNTQCVAAIGASGAGSTSIACVK